MNGPQGGSTDVCLPCPSGYFQEAAGQRGCLKCPFSAISNLNDSRNDDPQTKGLSSILQCRGVEKSMLTDSVWKYVIHLKLCQNKKGQIFVGMLVFWILFLNFNQLPAGKKGFKNRASLLQAFGPSYFDSL